MKKIIPYLILCLPFGWMTAAAGCAHAPSKLVMQNYQSRNMQSASSQNEQFWAYYHRLNAEEKKLYKIIYEAILAVKKSVELTGNYQDNVYRRIFNGVYYDHPELFWITDGFECTITDYGNGTYKAVMTFDYTSLAWNLDEKIAQFEAEAEKILSVARTLNSVEEKELYVHNQIASKVNYNLKADSRQSAFSAIVNHEAVCTGYAKAFQFLMNRLGIPTMVVTGKLVTEHAWNIINIRGQYYNVDVTNDKLDVRNASNKTIQIPIYKYFNRTDAEFEAMNYRRTSSYSTDVVRLPECNATDSSMEVIGLDIFLDAMGAILPVTRSNVVRSMEDFNQLMKREMKALKGETLHVYAFVVGETLLNLINNISKEAAEERYINYILSTKFKGYSYRKEYTAYSDVANDVYIYIQHGQFIR